ncbi:MAG: DISARM system SNF2-like helicase DrmD, partial [Thermoleophilaceae bacterium]
DTLIWEREGDARVLAGAGWPRIDDGRTATNPDTPELFAAFCDALRWTSSARLNKLTGDEPALLSPWESAVVPEPYQLYPVLKALEMPRVNLLLADDVGLGKTIEAGLVLRELLNRRRIRRVLVICPASLQLQWQDELRTKFSLEFDVLDRAAFTNIQREYGMDANPWTVTSRAITSMDFFRQPDVQQQFLAAAETMERGHALAVDLLVVDEAHNLAPQGFSERSDRAQMLAEVAPHAEHRLFLSATPHNGFTASFSGLLETLDPVRFRQTGELDEAERKHLELVMVRRMKSELNDEARAAGRPTPFTHRSVSGLPYRWTTEEQRLTAALREYRRAGTALLARLGRREQLVGRFVFSLLTKRLLSSPYALARTWWAHIEGYATTVSLDEARLAAERAEQQLADDSEKARREEDVVRQGAGWLQRYEAELTAAREEVSAALLTLGWGRAVVEHPLDPDGEVPAQGFPPDGKWTALRAWIEERLRDGDAFRADERGLVFTEYKDTLDYLLTRLRADGLATPQVRRLFGGSTLAERAEVKQAFTADEDPARLLVATDVAAEGLNLQTSCRYVLHYEVPWNPMRLEQRNGRVDRHGQGRDVIAFHFTSEADEDVAFLDYVVRKVDTVREDLGSVGELFDRALDQHFAGDAVDAAELDRRLATTLKGGAQRLDLAVGGDPIAARAGADAGRALADTAARLRLSPEAIERLLTEAVRLERGALDDVGDGTRRLRAPRSWQRVVSSSLRSGLGGAMPRLVFDPAVLMQRAGEREVFRERPDRQLIRLGHPIMRRATATLRRRLWEADPKVGRFTILGLPGLEEPVMLVSALAELTRELREPLHAELLELAVAFTDPTRPVDIPDWSAGVALPEAELVDWGEAIEDRWGDLRPTLDALLAATRADLEERAGSLLPAEQKAELAYQRQLFTTRINELRDRSGEAGRNRVRRELAKQEVALAQMTFDPDHEREVAERVRRLRDLVEGEEYRRIEARRARMQARIERERDHLLGDVLPRRYALARCALTPAAVALLVPAGASA